MIKVFDNADKLSKVAAELISDISNRAIEKRSNFSFVLSGGSSPKQTYKFLTQSPYKDEIPWNKTYFFWGDERFVPVDDPNNNYNMSKDIFLKKIPVPENHIFPIPTTGIPADCAIKYEEVVKNFFGSSITTFDLILLGLGDNGHTASLFPHTEVLTEEKRLVKEVFVKELDMFRITMTASLINKAKNILFLVFGKEKAEAVSKIIEGEYNPQNFPAQLIKPLDGTIRWFLDKAAASKLKIIE
jgi:6-phosphogluconolactonase